MPRVAVRLLRLAGRIGAVLAAGFVATPAHSAAPELWVGPKRPFQSIAAAVAAAEPGATIWVETGRYPGNVALIDKDGLSLRASGGPVDIPAAGRAVEGKGTFVVRAEGVLIEGFTFSGNAVRDRNGAGIRFDRGRLTVRGCRFIDNEAGLLAGNDPRSILLVEGSEFARNGANDGQTHHLYAGSIARLTVVGSYFHHGQSGQLIKSRAELSEILYNRLTDEDAGRASYELEFPNGGRAVVVGNLIEQSATTENRTIVSYGAEGYRGAVHELYLVHNTLQDRRRYGGQFLAVKPGAVKVWALNNLFTGGTQALNATGLTSQGNQFLPAGQFAQPEAYDYRLRASSPALQQAVPVGELNGLPLKPQFQYRHPLRIEPLRTAPSHPGALQDVAPASTSAPHWP